MARRYGELVMGGTAGEEQDYYVEGIRQVLNELGDKSVLLGLRIDADLYDALLAEYWEDASLKQNHFDEEIQKLSEMCSHLTAALEVLVRRNRASVNEVSAGQ